MSTKMKIILVIFGVVLFLFFIQSMISMVSTEKKKDRTWNDVQESFEEEENDKPADAKPSENTEEKKEEAKPDEKKDQALRIELLDAIDKAFENIPGAKEHRDQKPVVFDMLSEKSRFDELRSSKTVELDVKAFVEKHLQTVKKEADKVPNGTADPTKELQVEKLTEIKQSLESTLDVIKNVLSSAAPASLGVAPKGSAESFEWSTMPLSKIRESMVNLSDKTSPSALATTPEAPTPASAAEKKPSSDVVEGFENIRNYAFF